jgi:hypothetical protein
MLGCIVITKEQQYANLPTNQTSHGLSVSSVSPRSVESNYVPSERYLEGVDGTRNHWKSMTLSKLRQLNIKNGGCFFNRDTMKFFRDTMNGFTLQLLQNGNLEVCRKNGKGRWHFSPVTGRVVESFGHR